MKRPFPVKHLFAAALALVVVAACSGSGGGSPSPVVPIATPTPVPAASPQASPSQAPTTLEISPTSSSSPAGSASPQSGAPGSPAPATPGPGGEITLLTHDSFALSDPVLTSFEQASGISVKVLKAGDAGQMVNQAILSRGHPLGDVLFGVDNTFLSRALDAGIFVPYTSPNAATLPAAFQLDPGGRVTPIDYGDVCLNVDLAAFASGNPPAPMTLADLTRPQYKGMLVVENPATSSPGLAFMLATVVRYGESGSYTWLDYWKDLRANDVKVSPSWDDAYDTQFSGSAGHGDRAIVVSYASSPPAEVYFAASPPPSAPTAAILDGCFRQVEFAGVLAGGSNPTGAQAFIDFLLSPAAQEDIPLQMFVFPVVPNTPLPPVFAQYAQVPSAPLTLDPGTIEANRDRWINEWTDAVLH